MVNRLSLLVDLASLLTREVDFDALLATTCERVAEALSAERATIWLVDAERGDLVSRVAILPELPTLRLPLGRGIAGWVARTGDPVRIADASKDERFDASVDKTTGYTTRSILAVPIREEGRGPVRGVVQVLNRSAHGTNATTASPVAFDEEDEKYLLALAGQIARAFSLTTLRPANEGGPGLTLRGPFNRIIGRSPELRAVYERVTLAAQTDATVLLRGETGTGKGLFSRAIHVNSGRQAGPFVTVDCTTLPIQLVESELFGHERGAFTGADRRVPGRVELAQGGTLFLDEIGDLPHDVQGKLLRFLQERTFERVGGRQTMTADVRVVCATHQDLEQRVADGRFRGDLYYRIRVVEIEIPPLRTRGETEIEQLAIHFADMYAKRYKRPPPVLGPDALAVLRAHTWPGNVRELEHWVESAIVLAPDGRVGASHLPRPRKAASVTGRTSDPGLPAAPAATTTAPIVPLGLTLEEATRRYVAATVDVCDGNKAEAARRLDVGRNTIGRILKGERESVTDDRESRPGACDEDG
ncbi:MAG: sigma-54-dependent Fis family transcriptional regulator [Myxococcales bacterium 68-20]|nr:sigma-54-dependent Fis family transcriptional regulator [Myxococcales bacterium]OJY18132.1 MAG: sigma-54-dependent Fis family transcriptional regulator [Myxococcales bacterium 68-20]